MLPDNILDDPLALDQYLSISSDLLRLLDRINLRASPWSLFARMEPHKSRGEAIMQLLGSKQQQPAMAPLPKWKPRRTLIDLYMERDQVQWYWRLAATISATTIMIG